MNTKYFAVVIVLLVIGGVIIWAFRSTTPLVVTPENPIATTTPSTVVLDQSISDGVITVLYPSAYFGLATNKTQILTKAYIPPCSETFKYCLYYTGNEYTGTNFESAGVRVAPRADLKTERLCLSTPPDGYDAEVLPNATTSSNTYSTSTFSPIGDAGAGHYSTGSLYRLFYRNTSACYDIETRIGATQFQNYPTGTIQEFTATKQAEIQSKIDLILRNITLPSGVKNPFAIQ